MSCGVCVLGGGGGGGGVSIGSTTDIRYEPLISGYSL